MNSITANPGSVRIKDVAEAAGVRTPSDESWALAVRMLRGRLDMRRARRGGLGEVISRLLGMELKLRQYKLGKAFCDAIVEESGIDGLNRVWSAPEALPTADELEQPSRWLERVGGRPAAAAA